MRSSVCWFLFLALGARGFAASPQLASSASAFVREQAGSPIDWQPWSAATLQRAKEANRPVYVFLGSFLSELSRATCRQTFANADTTAFLNAHFFCIMVDREEQADVAAYAQHYLRTVKQLNGWPAHLWLTPELQPFEGASYLPPSEEWGKASFFKIAQQAQETWAASPAGCRARSAEAVTRLAAPFPPLPAGGSPPEKLKTGLTGAADAWRASFDAAHGGFSEPPKNPEPELLRFLLHQSPADREAALTTLRKLTTSALRDPLDGGFFHNATDARWNVPYPQKTLADQARLALAFLEAVQGDDAKTFAPVVRGALDFALTRLARPDGTFAAAEDATAEEFAGYYAWTEKEIDTVLGPDAAAFKPGHGVEAAGNVSADDDLAGTYHGKNLLRSAAANDAALAAKLLAARGQRPAPPRDDGATAGAHGLLLAALSRAGAQLNEPRYLTAGGYLLDAVKKEFLLTKDGDLRRLRGSAAPASPADYAALAYGCREFARAAKSADADALATQLLAKAGSQFFAPASGRYYATPATLPAGIAARPPAGNDAPIAESLALLAGVPPEQAKAITAALVAMLDDPNTPAPGDVLLALSQFP
jgi:uncharacterized protein YyaL (SSP411 family)